MRIKKYIISLIPILILSYFGLIFIGIPSLLGTIDIQTYSDSLTYESYARNMPVGAELVSIKGNFLGPILILEFLNYNYFYIYLFNTVLLVCSIVLLIKYYSLKWRVLLFFMFLDPLVYFSLWNANKEILSIFLLTLLLVYLKNKKIILIILTIFLSIFVRWQLTLFVVIVFLLMLIDKIVSYRKTFFIITLISLSILYPYISFVFIDILEHAETGGMRDSGRGLYPVLNNIQNHIGGYILAYPIKLMQLAFGQVFKINNILNFEDFWNNFVLTLHSISSLVLLLYVLYKRKFSFNNFIIYIVFIYSLLFTLTPVYNTRYLFPIYIFLVVVASQKDTKDFMKRKNNLYNQNFKNCNSGNYIHKKIGGITINE